jgi:hypothetical protein
MAALGGAARGDRGKKGRMKGWMRCGEARCTRIALKRRGMNRDCGEGGSKGVGREKGREERSAHRGLPARCAAERGTRNAIPCRTAYAPTEALISKASPVSRK